MDHFYVLLLVMWSCGAASVDGSLRLTSFPATATEGSLFTLVCTSSRTTVPQRTWSRETVDVLATQYSNTSCDTVVLNSGVFDTYLGERVEPPTCDMLRHNVTLRINSSIDDGTEWWCKDTNGTSNTLTIDVRDGPPPTTLFPQTTTPTDVASSTARDNAGTGSTTVVSSLTSTQSVGQTSVTSPEPEEELPIIYIAVAGGVAVVIIIVIVVSVVIIRRRKAHTVKLGEDGNVVKTTEV